MKSRGMRARLDALATQLPVQGLLCALHGDLCQMGRRWPLTGPEVELYYLIRGARIEAGTPVVEPDPYTVNVHRPQTAEERREGATLLEAARAKAAADEAEILAGGNPA